MPSFTHRLAVEVLQASNRLLPAPALPGDVDDLDYAQWEYETSDTALALWERDARVPRRALDVGCGLGGKTLRLAEQNPDETEWWALDISGDHLAGARRFEIHRRGANRIHWLRGDAARLPFPDASFDRIITADALEHFPQPRQALRELRRCLSQDGRLVLLFNPWYSPRGSHLGDVLRLP